ncbi:MAG: hypothetical protein P4L67_00505 [Candidatus Pacebacteria bacterium]|nr:hypothetical protein [Candidatus Paceibacterota bacterium]
MDRLFKTSAGVIDGFYTLIVVAVMLYGAALFLNVMIAPLSPTVTMIVILALTCSTFGKWTTGALALTGIAVYVASWPASAWGTWLETSIGTIGFLIWGTAVYLSCSRILKRHSMTQE